MRRAILVLCSIGCALLLAELVLRAFLPQALAFDTAAIWEPVEGLGWQRRANLDVAVNTGERTVRVLSDARGHRIGAARRPRPDLSVLAIGDSFVEALQVEAEQTMTALLAESLTRSSGRTVDVVNAGVGGWDANQYRIAARHELERARYDVVLIFFFLENDRVAQRVDSFRAARPPTMPFLMRHSHLYVYGRNWRELQRMRTGARRSHLLTSIMRTEADSPDWQMTGDVLADIAALASPHRTNVVHILIPPNQYLDERALDATAGALGLDRSQLDVSQPARLLTAQLAAKGLVVFDATTALRRAYDTGTALYGRIDRHFAPAGHRVMAGALQPIILPYLAAGRHE